MALLIIWGKLEAEIKHFICKGANYIQGSYKTKQKFAKEPP